MPTGADSDAAGRSPEAAARAEIAEETGLLDACEFVRAGTPFAVEDADHGTWRVHPFLFDCSSPAVDTNAEAADAEWVTPTEILRRETVPWLWTSYDRVRPTVASVRADREHGSAYCSLRALDVLRDRAGELAVEADRSDAGAWAALADLAAELLDARPGMAAVANRVNRAMAKADARTPAAVEASAQAVVEDALAADEAAAGVAADRVAGTVLTLSRSGTVLAALRRAALDEVVVAASHPGGEGVAVAEALAAEGEDVTLVPDAAVGGRLADGDVDAVLVGADAVLPDGAVLNKVGTRAAAVAAAREGVPVSVVAARDKVRPEDGGDPVPAGPAGAGDRETADPSAVYDGDADVAVEAPLFDVTSATLVDAVLTEDGALETDDVAAVAAEHRAHAEWQSREPDPGGTQQ